VSMVRKFHSAQGVEYIFRSRRGKVFPPAIYT
jgi:hypothetical protein